MVTYMINLDPNKTYIYERVDEKIYAREVGTLNRILLGNDVTSNEYLEEWKQIFIYARTNAILQEELDRVRMLFYLLKENDNTIQYHPV